MKLLTWVAARTTRVQLGTIVTVLPWHDPVRLSESSRCSTTSRTAWRILGLGRGPRPGVEFDGFRLAMADSAARFAEYAT